MEHVLQVATFLSIYPNWVARFEGVSHGKRLVSLDIPIYDRTAQFR